jgi:hypothetical protein
MIWHILEMIRNVTTVITIVGLILIGIIHIVKAVVK